jgi:hypothetical protein
MLKLPAFLIIILLMSSCDLLPDFMKTKIKKPPEPVTDITGTWKIIYYKAEDAGGRFHYPYGREVDGLIVFDPFNNFSIQFYDSDRPSLSKSDPYYCADPEIRIAFLSSFSSYGIYQLTENKIVMETKNSNLPGRSGQVVEYTYRQMGDTLLTASPALRLSGVDMTEHTLWVRLR